MFQKSVGADINIVAPYLAHKFSFSTQQEDWNGERKMLC